MPHNEEIARTVNSKVMMKGHPYQILWLLPIVFAFHNIEELLFFPRWANYLLGVYPFMHFSWLFERKNVAMAMVLLTVTVGFIVWMEYKNHNGYTLHFTIYCICLLLVNGMVHVGQFFVYRHYVPGLITAVLLMIPYLIYVLYLLIKNNFIQMRKVFLYFVLSMITMSPLIIVFLLISRLMVR